MKKNKMVKIERSFMNVIHLELNFDGIIDMVEWKHRKFTFPMRTMTKTKHRKRNEGIGE